MESAEQPTKKLHANVEAALGQLGHKVSTIPPHEGPALTDELQGIAEDLGYNAKTALEEAVSGGVTHVRTTQSKKSISIARIRGGLIKKFSGKKAA